jgi:hypothetical protein
LQLRGTHHKIIWGKKFSIGVKKIFHWVKIFPSGKKISTGEKFSRPPVSKSWGSNKIKKVVNQVF